MSLSFLTKKKKKQGKEHLFSNMILITKCEKVCESTHYTDAQ